MSQYLAVEQKMERVWIGPFQSVESLRTPARTACFRVASTVDPSLQVADRMSVAGGRLDVAASGHLADTGRTPSRRRITGCEAVTRIIQVVSAGAIRRPMPSTTRELDAFTASSASCAYRAVVDKAKSRSWVADQCPTGMPHDHHGSVRAMIGSVWRWNHHNLKVAGPNLVSKPKKSVLFQ